MPAQPDEIETFILTHIQPKVRVDGGYISIAAIAEDRVVLLAQADCANCPAGKDCLEWWIGSELEKRFGYRISVTIRRDAPYYAR